ncbi:predicted protein [Streptomyces viridochromogenes DSM 40736]|uniref:Predicted protein n=1 Tax=Streptomyces viridochromogenes (strain DSM 40736 / JCM 4977 / BCRC 1201 / Tue 494) TaxID=591159 RepID=D9X6A6_STRVT|nr:hypothetical protein [Streptomyces viridochromogenes]EFL29859.1 predicted protein [Streptomyces viridochromogenes DSM 40736]
MQPCRPARLFPARLLVARLGVVEVEELLLGRVQSGRFHGLEQGLVVGAVLRGEFFDLRVMGIDAVVEGGVGRVETVCLGPWVGVARTMNTLA